MLLSMRPTKFRKVHAERRLTEAPLSACQDRPVLVPVKPAISISRKAVCCLSTLEGCDVSDLERWENEGGRLRELNPNNASLKREARS
jgi:hypothetical protein